MRTIFKKAMAVVVASVMALSVGAFTDVSTTTVDAATNILQSTKWTFYSNGYVGRNTTNNQWNVAAFRSVRTNTGELYTNLDAFYPGVNVGGRTDYEAQTVTTLKGLTGFDANIENTGWEGQYWETTKVADDPFVLHAKATDIPVKHLEYYTLSFDVKAVDFTTDGGKEIIPNKYILLNIGNGTVNGKDVFETIKVPNNGSTRYSVKFLAEGDFVDVTIAMGNFSLSNDVVNGLAEDSDGAYVKNCDEPVATAGTLKFSNIQLTGKETPKPTEPATKPAVKVTKPGKPSIKATNIKGKKVKVTWKAVKGATKYQVKAVTGKKTITKKTVKKAYTLTKLTKKKTYKIYVRAYNKAGWGKWSKVKKVTVKK